MIKTTIVDGVHRPRSEANKYTPEELMLMKTQDMGYMLQKIQSEKKKIERLNATLHSLGNHPPNRHVYYAEDRFRYMGSCIEHLYKTRTIIGLYMVKKPEETMLDDLAFDSLSLELAEV
ncbi:hypothetical protein Nepgr_004184 [Nepenthes gracilis]|uniref:Uncharacterized protein n=1 Tax=Nepenthes gracilis TaxID=150966 RepID=A0AAD3S0W0_NEPGR|nr:hypothetical protein Nepgr_004184 [Nepenthes gracilis]